MYENFCLKKSKLKWTGTLKDLKAFVLAEIDANTAENVSWRSPSGGKWTFVSEALSVTWHKTSENIYLKGEKGNHLTKQIHLFLTASEDDLESANPVETELDKSINNLLADDDDMTNDNSSKESVCMAALTPARVSKPSDDGQAEKALINHHHKHEKAISNLVNTKFKASSLPASENLHNEFCIRRQSCIIPQDSPTQATKVTLKLIF